MQSTGLFYKMKPIHPFPARMAPEIAFEALNGLKKQSIILDPMTGSGTVMRTISELGFQGIGFDIDPLAILMAKAWTSRVQETDFVKGSDKLIKAVSSLTNETISLPWIDEDIETQDFIRFWFAPTQIIDLKKLSYKISTYSGRYLALYKIALSRLIITKSGGASLAADISHSRPHRVKKENDFDVIKEFDKSCKYIAKTLNSDKLMGSVNIYRGDARRLSRIKNNSIDSIITSPPYLNALDYMRGHKLSLVWLGHKINALTTIRSGSVGAEKAPDKNAAIIQAKYIVRNMESFDDLPSRLQNMIHRYALDMRLILGESSRVLKKHRHATFVIGNSNLKGVDIDNTQIAEEAAKEFGLKVVKKTEREIPQNKRYLPPPQDTNKMGLNARMRTETILLFKKV